MSTVPVTGTVKPFVPGQRVEVSFFLNGKRIETEKVRRSTGGSFRARIRIEEAGKYAASAQLAATRSCAATATVRKSWRVSLPGAAQGPVRRGRDRLQEGDAEDGLHRQRRALLRRQDRARRARLPQSQRHGAQLRGPARAWSRAPSPAGANTRSATRGPAATSRRRSRKQVLVFAKGDKPLAVYPISSGKSSTPTVTGHFTFIRTEPGYNSHGMYYSWYFYGGYAVHGYESVPDYPASHGCLRTFIADQPEIYERINYGEDIFVF